jgi:DNA-binding LacI/PurR family transcriptional regulator
MVTDTLRAEIASGSLQQGQILESESALCRRFGISRITARRSLAVLGQEGLVETIQGKGRFVTERPETLAREAQAIRVRVLVDNTEDTIHDPWFLEAIEELNRPASRLTPPCRLLYEFHRFTNDRDPVALEMLAAGDCQGVLVIPFTQTCMDLLASRPAGQTPVVSFLRRLRSGPCSRFYVDQEAGAFRATDYLIRLGHRRIGLVNVAPEQSTPAAEDRDAGYRRALAAAGLAAEPELIVRPPWPPANVRNACLELLGKPGRPTAVLIGGSGLLKASLQALHESALRVPDQLSVIAFDDIPETQLHRPALTVVKQPLREGIRQAMNRLLAEIRGAADGPVEVVLKPELVVRDSCAARAG